MGQTNNVEAENVTSAFGRKHSRASRPPGDCTGKFYSLPVLAKHFPNVKRLPLSHAHRAGVGAAQLRRPEGHGRACPAACQLVPQRRPHHGNPVHGGARRAAGLHRRAAAGRPGRDAQRRRTPGQGRQRHRAAGAGGPGGGSLDHGGLLRHPRGAGPQHETGVPAQSRALRIHEVGHAGFRYFRRRSARLRHRASGQPRIPRPRRAPGARMASATSTPWWAPTATRR